MRLAKGFFLPFKRARHKIWLPPRFIAIHRNPPRDVYRFFRTPNEPIVVLFSIIWHDGSFEQRFESIGLIFAESLWRAKKWQKSKILKIRFLEKLSGFSIKKREKMKKKQKFFLAEARLAERSPVQLKSLIPGCD